jgi:hypothetical protein
MLRWMTGVLAAALGRSRRIGGPGHGVAVAAGDRLVAEIGIDWTGHRASAHIARPNRGVATGLRAENEALRGDAGVAGRCEASGRGLFVYRHELRRIAQQLRRWSDESHAGGWSTHLCGPMEALAAQIYQHIGSATGISHEQMLRDVSRHLMRWSNESMTGGWSTQHQVGAAAVRVREGLRALHGPMRALASRIEVGIEAATRPPSCVEYWDGWPA